MKKFAITVAAAVLMATPALAQYVVGPQPYGNTYAAPFGGPYAYAPGPYATAPYDPSVYSRDRDIATSPDPNVRLQLRREKNLNSGTYPD